MLRYNQSLEIVVEILWSTKCEALPEQCFRMLSGNLRRVAPCLMNDVGTLKYTNRDDAESRNLLKIFLHQFLAGSTFFDASSWKIIIFAEIYWPQTPNSNQHSPNSKHDFIIKSINKKSFLALKGKSIKNESSKLATLGFYFNIAMKPFAKCCTSKYKRISIPDWSGKSARENLINLIS